MTLSSIGCRFGGDSPRPVYVWFGLVCLGLSVCLGCSGGSEPSAGTRSYAEEVADMQKTPDPDTRARGLVKIGYKQAKARDSAGAETSFHLAADACSQIKDAASRAKVYSFLATAQARVEQFSGAKRSVAAAHKAADEITDNESKAKTLADIGLSAGLAKDLDTAAKALKTAEDLCDKLKDGAGAVDAYGQLLVLSAVLESYGKIGQTAEAERIADVAMKTIEKIDNEGRRAASTAEIAAKLHGMKKGDQARKVFDKAVEMARKIEKPQTKVHALIDIAAILAKTGDAAKTKALLDEAEALTLKIPEPDMRQQAIEKVRNTRNATPVTNGG